MTANEWAAGIQPGTTVRWRALETAAFAGHPDVAHRIDPLGEFGPPRPAASGGGARMLGAVGKVAFVAVVIVGVIVFYFPAIFGVATLIGDRFGREHPDPFVTIPVTGVIFAYVFVTLVITFVPWVRGGRKKDLLRESQALAAAGLGIISVFLAWSLGASAGVPNWQLWTAVMAVATVFAIVYCVMTLRAHRAETVRSLKARLRGDVDDDGDDTLPREPVKRVRQVIDRLTDEDKQAVRRDLEAAIADLASRGVITADAAGVARGCALGALSLRMEAWQQRSGGGGVSHPAGAAADAAE
jgi:hypothetical protein